MSQQNQGVTRNFVWRNRPPQGLSRELTCGEPHDGHSIMTLSFQILEPAVAQRRWDLVRLVIQELGVQRRVIPLGSLKNIAMELPAPVHHRLTKLCVEVGMVLWAIALWTFTEHWQDVRNMENLVSHSPEDCSDIVEILCIYPHTPLSVIIQYTAFASPRCHDWSAEHALSVGTLQEVVTLLRLIGPFPSRCYVSRRLLIYSRAGAASEARDFLKAVVQVGIGAAQWNYELGERDPVDSSSCTYLHPALLVLWTEDQSLATLFFQCWPVSNQVLFELKNSRKLQEEFDDMERSGKTSCRAVLQGLPNSPPSLLNLSRNTVSAALGPQLGQEEKIEALPVPPGIKDLLRYEDIFPPHQKKGRKRKRSQHI